MSWDLPTEAGGAIVEVTAWGATLMPRITPAERIAPSASIPSPPVKRADWVTTRQGGRGFVKRAARDGSWADVSWGDPRLGEWTKRMQTEYLIVVTTLPLPGGWTVTDVTREEELR